MRRKVPKRNGSDGISRRQALGLVGTVVGGGGVLAGLQRSDAFTTAGTDRDSQVEIEQDSNAVVPITGKTAEITPEFGNEFGTDLTITLSAPNESSAGFDVGMTGTTESTTTFTVTPRTTTRVGMNADISPISVAIDGVHGNGEVSLTRDFEIPASAAERIERVSTQTKQSDSLTFTLENGGNCPVTVDGFALETDVQVETIERVDPSVVEVTLNGDQVGTADSSDGFSVDGQIKALDTNARYDPGTSGRADFGLYDSGNVKLTIDPVSDKPSSYYLSATLQYGDGTSETFHFKVTNVNS